MAIHQCFSLKVYSKTSNLMIYVTPKYASIQKLEEIKKHFKADECRFEIIGWFDNIHSEIIPQT